MWKLALACVALGALSLFVILKGGEQLDMGGEKHGADTTRPAPAAAR